MSVDRSEIVRIRTTSESDTEELGRKLGIQIDSGLCISLVGALGTGKTVFARGLCRGLGVEELILSPTFILYEEFSGRVPVVHLDLYRLVHESEIEELGVFEKLTGTYVVITEWGDRSEMILNASDMVVSLRLRTVAERDIEFHCTRPAAEYLHTI
jgi:tRNA threonylcarbamoyladenosine biosynthesis protein TsaE